MMRNAVLCCVVGSIACKSTPTPAPAGPALESPPVATVDAALPPPPPPAVAPDVATVDIKASAAAAFAKLSPARAKRAKTYAALLGALATCNVDSSGELDKQCKSFHAIAVAREQQRNSEHWLDVQRAAWWMHAQTPSASVRAYLIDDVASLDQDLAAVLIDAETDEHQLEHLLDVDRAYRPVTSPVLVKALTARTAHRADDVRRSALWALAAINPPLPPGVHRTLVAAIDRDTSLRVRAETCRVAGWSQDDRMLPVFDRLLVPATQAELFDACAEGLTTMWTRPPEGHQAAYRRTVKLLDTGRRDTPMRATWEALAVYGRDRHLYSKHTPWVKDAEVRAALERRIVDRTANLVGRVGAAMVFVRFGTRDDLKALRARLGTAKGSDQEPVVECIERALFNEPSCHSFFLSFAPK